MFYLKRNLPTGERTLRVLMGVALVAVGLFVLHAAPAAGWVTTAAGWAVVPTGVVAALTGFVGYCPMCAMVGRRAIAPRE